MTVHIEQLIALCEASGCAVPPPHVLALIDSIRKYAGLVADMAVMIYDRNVCSGAEMDGLTDRMIDARTVRMPRGVRS